MKPFFPQARRQNGDSEVQALHAAPAHALPALRRRAHPRKRPCARGRLHRRRYGPLGSRVRLPRRRRFDPRPVDDAEGRLVLLRQRNLLEPQDRGRHPREREPHVAHRHAPARPQHGEPLPLRAHPPRVRGRILRGHSRARRGRLRHARYLFPGRHQDRGQRQQVHVRAEEVHRQVPGGAPPQGARPPRGDRRAGRRGGGAGPRRPLRSRRRRDPRRRGQDQREAQGQARGGRRQRRRGQGAEKGLRRHRPRLSPQDGGTSGSRPPSPAARASRKRTRTPRSCG